MPCVPGIRLLVRQMHSARRPQPGCSGGPTRYKSCAGEDAILHNDSSQVVGQLPIELVDSFSKGVLELNSTTWLLLYRRTAKFGLRAEISHPVLAHDRVITDWKERLILPEEQFIEENTPLDADTDDVYFEIREA